MSAAMTGILLLDDLENYIRTFTQEHLGPALERTGLKSRCKLVFFSYRHPQSRRVRSEKDVAVSVDQWLKRNWLRCSTNGTIKHLVFITDLAPELASTPNREYGPKVLLETAKLICPGGQLDELIADGDILATLLSNYLLPDMQPTLLAAWGVLPNNIQLIRKGQYVLAEGAVAAVNTGNPRIVLANRAGVDDEWIAKIVCEWIQSRP